MKIDLELYRREVVVREDPLVRLSAIDIGPPHPEKTLLFIHGFGGYATQWKFQLEFFSDLYRVVALDLRGHGLADTPDFGYTIPELLKDFETAIEHLQIKKPFTLIAHSFGAALSAEYALRHAEHLEKLICISPSSNFVLHPLINWMFRFPGPMVGGVRKLVGLYRRTLMAPAHVVKPFYHHCLVPWRGAGILQYLKIPTLVITGHRDFLFSKKAVEEFAALIPNAQRAVIPVSAHMVHVERPEAVNRAIARFLDSSASGEMAHLSLARIPTRPWHAHYENGVPYEVRIPDAPLHRFLSLAARRRPSHTALIFYGERMRYWRLEELSNRFAQALGALGVQKGDRVMILLPNVPQCVIAYYGVLKAGAVVVFSNPLSPVEELAHQLRDCAAKVLVTLSSLGSKLQGMRPPKTIVTSFDEYLPLAKKALFRWRNRIAGHSGTDTTEIDGEGTLSFRDLLKRAPSAPLQVHVDPEDLAVIEYTSGTTDLPKGVMLTHRNLVANAIQIRYWLTETHEGQALLAVLPFSHSYGMTACLNLGILLGDRLILLPKFQTEKALRAIAKYHPTYFPGVPSMYAAINHFPGVRRYKISSVRACVSGAAPLPIEVQEAFQRLTRGRLVEGYGLTEASPVTHANPLSGTNRIGRIGLPLPNTDAKIVDVRTGRDLNPGETGELLVRGPQVMKGYWNRPPETREVLRDGWLRTGDIARMDPDGFFQIVDRKKNIIWAGEQPVYPREIEEVLYEHPKVLEAVVMGVPPGGAPQRIKAFIVLRPGESVTPEEILSFCRSRLREAQLPQLVAFRSELPKTFIGKIWYRALLEQEPRGATRI